MGLAIYGVMNATNTADGKPIFYNGIGESMDLTCLRIFGSEFAVDHTDTRKRKHIAYIAHAASGVRYGVYRRYHSRAEES